MIKRFAYSVAGVGVAAISFVGMASASAAYDLSGVTTGFTAQLQNAVTTALPIAAGVIALMVGWKILKRFVRG